MTSRSIDFSFLNLLSKCKGTFSLNPLETLHLVWKIRWGKSVIRVLQDVTGQIDGLGTVVRKGGVY